MLYSPRRELPRTYILMRGEPRSQVFKRNWCDNVIMEIFAERLKLLREEKGLSGRALAKAIGLGEATLRALENGTQIPLGTSIVLIAKYFGVTADYLLGLSQF